MKHESIINAFDLLGKHIKSYLEGKGKYYIEFQNKIAEAEIKNPWFTGDNIHYALKAISENLEKENLLKWRESYNFHKKDLLIAVVNAGNIPLVGFFDFLAVLVSGNRILCKLSSKDNVLLPFLSKILAEENNAILNKINFTTSALKNFDAIIATGSDNSAGYFEYYFNRYPCIIRKNRNSLTVLTGNETKEDIENLSEDIFRYFGLGCRNVSKIYLPEKFDLGVFKQSFKQFEHIINHNKYANNYDYNKSIYLLKKIPFVDNDFYMFVEDTSFISPISVIHFEYYNNIADLNKMLTSNKEKIQCIVSKSGQIENEVDFGQTQKPGLNDYSDNIDTMKFLSDL